jgi:hypothetical protein
LIQLKAVEMRVTQPEALHFLINHSKIKTETPPPNIDILLFFDGVWRVGRYFTEKAHFEECAGELIGDADVSPRFYCYSDGLERFMESVDSWAFLPE